MSRVKDKSAWLARLSAAHRGPARRPHKLSVVRGPKLPSPNKIRWR